MIKLTHTTSLHVALKIVSKREYRTNNNDRHYDAGMNFLGVLGEYHNTQPTRGAKLHCEWNGKYSSPLKPDAYKYHTPNELFDFNGSGKHFPNNDPRYFLPYGSQNLVVVKIEPENNYDEEALIEWWCNFSGGLDLLCYKLKCFKPKLLKKALNYLAEINHELSNKKVTISIVQGK